MKTARDVPKILLACVVGSNALALALLATLLAPPEGDEMLLRLYGSHPVYASREEAREILQDGLAVYLKSAEFDDLLSFRYRPLQTAAVNLDENADREVGVPRPEPGAPEIHLFGGSTLFGWGVRDDQTIAAYVQRLLPDHRVISHAQVSYTSFQELIQYQQILRRIPETSTILFYDGKNDFWVGCWESQQTHTIQSARNQFFWERGKAAIKQPVRDWLGFFHRPIEDAMARATGDSQGYSALSLREKMRCGEKAGRDRVFDSLFANWQSAQAITEARGGRFFAFLHPHLAASDARPGYIPEALLLDDRMMYRYLELYPEAAAAIRDRNLPWAIDLTGLYDHGSGEMLLLDHTHPTPRGSEIAAKAIVERIAGVR